ncbi:hypothetical protein ES705_41719 [subsurface metagenome]
MERESHLNTLTVNSPGRSPCRKHSGLSLFTAPLSRAERTPEVAAVSGVYRGRPGGEESSPGIPRANLKPLSLTALAPTISTPSESIDNNRFPYYLDYIDKGIFPEAKLKLPPQPKKCGLWAVVGQCENGHRYAKRLYCGKPWCEECRDIMQRRKVARCLPRVQQFETMAYLVIRPPNKLQPLLRTKASRASFTTKVWKALRAVGYRRGVWFKHDFGERSTRYAFHLNILVDGGYLEPEVLDHLKRKLRRLIYPRSVMRQWGDKLDIFYEYRQTPAEMMHTLNYCTKATFLDTAWDEELAGNLFREHYSGCWGKWNEAPKWELPESARKLQTLVSLQEGNCPKCGEPVTWGRHPLPFVLVLMENPIPLDNGYYALPDIRPPPPWVLRHTNLTELPDGDPRKKSNLVKGHGEREADFRSLVNDYEAY